jgi:hypothetical protein
MTEHSKLRKKKAIGPPTCPTNLIIFLASQKKRNVPQIFTPTKNFISFYSSPRYMPVHWHVAGCNWISGLTGWSPPTPPSGDADGAVVVVVDLPWSFEREREEEEPRNG